MPPKTRHPPSPVVASRLPDVPVPTAVYLAIAVTPLTPPVGAGALPTSTSSADPVGGVMTLESRTGFLLPSCGQVTDEVIRRELSVWPGCLLPAASRLA